MDALSSSPAVANVDAALVHAIRHGLMSDNQYRFLVERFLSAAPCSLLVFGLGHDARLWWHSTHENTAFVEDDPTYLTLAPVTAPVLLHEFPSRVGKWAPLPEPSPLIDRSWDFVIVDGPRGYNRSCPGRQIPIAWARQLARRQIFVHDYERPWERQLCDKMLGRPADRLKSTGGRRGELAAFDAVGLP